MWSNVRMPDVLPLVFDRQASTATPAADAVHAWAASQRVFVSSLINDMRDERAAVREAILNVGAVPVMFEHDLGAQDQPAQDAYLDGVRQSGIYVGIFGPRYGVRLPSGRSATHDELSEAERLGLRLCLFTKGFCSAEMDREQSDVIAGLQNLYTTSSFANADDLASKLEARLRELAAEALLPWVLIGHLLLRANSISTNGNLVGVSASIFDRNIIAQLQRLADGRSGDLPFATHLDAANVRVVNVRTDVTNAAFAEVTISLERHDVSSSGLSRMGMNGMGSDEISRRSLSDGLFGTTELPQGSVGFFRPVNPLAPLAGLGVPDRALRPIAQVLLTRYLLGDQLADSVEPIELGPSHQGQRWLKLTWQPRRQYSNQPPPTVVSISGPIQDL
jgi:hypothetical protein